MAIYDFKETFLFLKIENGVNLCVIGLTIVLCINYASITPSLYFSERWHYFTLQLDHLE